MKIRMIVASVIALTGLSISVITVIIWAMGTRTFAPGGAEGGVLFGVIISLWGYYLAGRANRCSDCNDKNEKACEHLAK